METNEQIFKNNLCQITGNGSLIKLDMADPVAEGKRHRLLAELGRELSAFNSAVFIYFCNVLEDMGVGDSYSERKKLITNLADALTVSYLLEATGGVSDETFSKKIEDVFHYGYWLDRKHYPSAEVLGKIRSDFKRIELVWRKSASLIS